MTDRPIIFTAYMAAALWEGRKSQTRRVLKPQPNPNAPIGGAEFVQDRWCWLNGYDGSIVGTFDVPISIGDRLWVREAWNAFQFSQDGDEAWPVDKVPTSQEMREAEELGHRYGAPQIIYRESDRARKWFNDQKWRPSIHMPRWASRMTLVVTDVRVQRVQEISMEDAIAEGCKGFVSYDLQDGEMPQEEFQDLWTRIHGPDAWGRNDWVYALTFETHRKNIDNLKGMKNES